MKRRVEGERDEGNTHLVQDMGSDWPNTKGNEKGKKRSCWAHLSLDSSGASFGAFTRTGGRKAHMILGRLLRYICFPRQREGGFSNFC